VAGQRSESEAKRAKGLGAGCVIKAWHLGRPAFGAGWRRCWTTSCCTVPGSP